MCARTSARQRGGTLLALVLILALLPLAAGTPADAATPCRRGYVSLTFDDGPRSPTTATTLDILRRENVRATFFVIGSSARARPALVRRAVAEGHQVANHTDQHENLRQLSDSRIATTLRRTERTLRDLGAPATGLMRPPYGSIDARVRRVLRAEKLTPVLWTIDPQDWRPGRSSAQIRDLVLGRLHDRAIILLHDGAGNAPAMLQALPAIIRGIRSQGYCFGLLSSSGAVVPAVPSLSISRTRQVVEGPADSYRSVRMEVTLSHATDREVVVRAVTGGVTATAHEDYRSTKATVRIPPGQTSAPVRVRVYGDDLDEPDEVFRVGLRDPVNATLSSRDTATITILDDDDPPRVSIKDVTVTEPTSGAVKVAVPIHLSAPSGRATRFRVTSQDGTATAASGDYDRRNTTVHVPPGTTRTSVDIWVRADALVEPPETFTLQLSELSHLRGGRHRATVTILDTPPS